MGWIGNALIITGAWQIGHRRRWGFLLTISGCACWVCVGFTLSRTDMVFIESVMACVALRNFIKWGST